MGTKVGNHARIGSAALGRVAAWVLLALVPVSLFSSCLRRPTVPPPPPPPVPTTPAASHANGAVRAWLEAGEGQAEAFKPWFGALVPNLRGVSGVRVAWTSVADVAEVGPDYWGVTVVAATAPDLATPPMAHWYQVPVQRVRVEGAAVAGAEWAYVSPAFPHEVGAPPLPHSPRLVVGTPERPTPDDPMAQRVGRFLSALLAGDGDVADYVSPGAVILPARPVPYASVVISAIASHRTASGKEVLVDVTATDAVGAKRQLQYPLSLVERDGRWWVDRILPAPSLASPESAPPLTDPVPRAVSTTTSTPTSSLPTTTTRVTRP